MDSKKTFNVILIYAFIGLVTVICIPVAGFGIGLIPEISYWVFSDAVGTIIDDPSCLEISIYLRTYFLAFLSPALVAVCSSARGKVMTIISSLFGVISLLYCMMDMIYTYGEESIFEFSECNVSISFWICMIVCAVSFFTVLSVRKD